jgi:hypothetical protein
MVSTELTTCHRTYQRPDTVGHLTGCKALHHRDCKRMGRTRLMALVARAKVDAMLRAARAVRAALMVWWTLPEPCRHELPSLLGPSQRCPTPALRASSARKPSAVASENIAAALGASTFAAIAECAAGVSSIKHMCSSAEQYCRYMPPAPSCPDVTVEYLAFLSFTQARCSVFHGAHNSTAHERP